MHIWQETNEITGFLKLVFCVPLFRHVFSVTIHVSLYPFLGVMYVIAVVLIQSLSPVQLFATPWTAASGFSVLHHLLELAQTQVHWVSGVNFILCCLLLLLQPFTASGSFLMTWFFASGGQSIGASASASVFPVNIQDSQESSPTPKFKSINSSALSLLYGPTLTSIHDYWKNHSFD